MDLGFPSHASKGAPTSKSIHAEPAIGTSYIFSVRALSTVLWLPPSPVVLERGPDMPMRLSTFLTPPIARL
jgi:hypothetical protein